MTAEEFRIVVQKFADREVDLVLTSRSLLVEVNREVIEVELQHKGGLLYCSEGGIQELAEQWIINRLGNLDLLANRILEFIPEDETLIPVRAEVTGVEPDEDGHIQSTEDLVELIPSLVDNLPAASINIIYLTSDAGEGKTCVMEALARIQARSFLDGKSDWILLPISLSGRPFMRLDEVIIAALANRFRFRYLPYEGLLELVKRRAIVLGLDGFEEMFIESQSGEVASSLGNLVAKLGSQGTLIFAARKAYYQYTNLEAQAKLFRSIQDMNVAFGEARLHRWNRDQFIQCCEQNGLTSANANKVYNAFTNKLPPDHPVLTRAVLARRAIMEVIDAGGEPVLADVLGNGDISPESVFKRFVDALIRREAEEKWIDRTGEAAAPLLSPGEHCTLLMALAEEMWLSGTEYLTWDVMEEITEKVVDALGKGPITIRQAKERIRQHALLQKSVIGESYAFDHEEFRAYFLGRALGRLLANIKISEVRRILSAQMLPKLSIRVAVSSVLTEAPDVPFVSELLREVCSSGPRSSYICINGAILLVRIISGMRMKGQELRDMYFLADTIGAHELSGIKFDSCIFDSISILRDPVTDVSFRSSTILELICQSGALDNSGSFDDASLPEVIRTGTDEDATSIYSPEAIRKFLKEVGFNLHIEEDIQVKVHEVDMDDRVVDVERIVRAFRKATQVNENLFAVKLGARWSDFSRNCLDDLIHREILVNVQYKGHGQQRRFKLGVGFDDVERARRTCGGSYDAFLDELSD